MADFEPTHPGDVLRHDFLEPLARAAALAEGAAVDIGVEDGPIVLSPRPPAAPTLAELLARITPDNLPDEPFDDAPVGDEAL